LPIREFLRQHADVNRAGARRHWRDEHSDDVRAGHLMQRDAAAVRLRSRTQRQ